MDENQPFFFSLITASKSTACSSGMLRLPLRQFSFKVMSNGNIIATNELAFAENVDQMFALNEIGVGALQSQ